MYDVIVVGTGVAGCTAAKTLAEKGYQEAYRQSAENLKSYMQRQWSLVGGMAGTFREMASKGNNEN